MPSAMHADERRRQHRADRSGIHPPVGMAADGAVDRTVIHAGAAADAAQHLAELAAEQLRAAVVENHDMAGLGPVGVAGAARPGRERGVGRDLLPRRRARQQPDQRIGVLQRRHQLVDGGEHDVHLGQRLGEVAVALVGHDHRRAGLGDQEIGARDADIGGQELLAQDLARLGDQLGRLGQHALLGQVGVQAAEVGLHLVLRQVNGGRDDVARRLAADLDQVFAEIGFDRFDAALFQAMIEPDLLRDHRFALGDDAGSRLPANLQDDVARIGGGRGVIHTRAGSGGLALEGLEIEIEMRQRVVLDLAPALAQRLELRQRGTRGATAGGEPRRNARQRLLQLGIGQRGARVVLEGRRGRDHGR